MNSKFTVCFIFIFTFFNSFLKAQTLPDKATTEIFSCNSSDGKKGVLKFLFKDGDIPDPDNFQYKRLYLQAPLGDGNVDYIFSAQNTDDFKKVNAPVLKEDTLIFSNLEIGAYVLYFENLLNLGTYYGGDPADGGTEIPSLTFDASTPDFAIPNHSQTYTASTNFGGSVEYSLFSSNYGVIDSQGEVRWNDEFNTVENAFDTVYAESTNACGMKVTVTNEVKPLLMKMFTFLEKKDGSVEYDIFHFKLSDFKRYTFEEAADITKDGVSLVEGRDFNISRIKFHFKDQGLEKSHDGGLTMHDKSVFDSYDENDDNRIDLVWMTATVRMSGVDYDLRSQTECLGECDKKKEMKLVLSKPLSEYCENNSDSLSIDESNSKGLDDGVLKWYVGGVEKPSWSDLRKVPLAGLDSGTHQLRVVLVPNSGEPSIKDETSIEINGFPENFLSKVKLTGACLASLHLDSALDKSLTKAYEVEYSEDATFDLLKSGDAHDGTYYVRLKSKNQINSKHCYSDAKTVEVEKDPVPQIQVTPPIEACKGDTVNLNDFITSVSKVYEKDSVYFYDDANPSTRLDSLFPVQKNSRISIRIHFEKECSTGEKVDVKMLDLPVLVVKADELKACASADLMDAIDVPNSNYTSLIFSKTKDFSTPLVANEISAFNTSGLNTIWVKALNASSCDTVKSFQVNVLAETKVSLVHENTQPTCDKSTGTISIKNPLANVSYTLKDASGMLIPVKEITGAKVFEDLATGDYTLTASSTELCQTESLETISINPFVPTLTFDAAAPDFAIPNHSQNYTASTNFEGSVKYSLYSEKHGIADGTGKKHQYGTINPNTGLVLWNHTLNMVDTNYALDTICVESTTTCGDKLLTKKAVRPLLMKMFTFLEKKDGSEESDIFHFKFSDFKRYTFEEAAKIIKNGVSLVEGPDFNISGIEFHFKDQGLKQRHDGGLTMHDKSVFDSYDQNSDNRIDSVWMTATVSMSGVNYDLRSNTECVGECMEVVLSKPLSEYCENNSDSLSIDVAESKGLDDGVLKWYVGGVEKPSWGGEKRIPLKSLAIGDREVKVELVSKSGAEILAEATVNFEIKRVSQIVLESNITQPTCDKSTGTISIKNPLANVSYTLKDASGVLIPVKEITGAKVFEALATGDYTLTASSTELCQTESSKTVTIVAPSDCSACELILGEVDIQNVNCSDSDNGTLKIRSAVGGSGFYTYTLLDSDKATVLRPQQNKAVFESLGLGDYYIELRDRNNLSCVVYSNLISIETQAGIKGVELLSKSNSKCFDKPNGAASFTMDSEEQSFEYFIDLEEHREWKNVSNRETLTGLPVGSYAILFRVNEQDLCPVSYDLSIENMNASDLTLEWESINQTDCDGNTGSFKVTKTSGGNGKPYQYKFMNSDFENLPEEGKFYGLGRSVYQLEVKDKEGCMKSFPVELGGPEVIDFAISATNPSCDGDDGLLEIDINTNSTNFPGPYFISVAKDGEFLEKELELSSSLKSLEGMSYGDYEISVKVSDSEKACPNQKNIVLDKIGTKIKYDLELIPPACKDDDVTVLISNLFAEKNNGVNVTIYNQNQSVVDSFSIAYRSDVDFISESKNLGKLEAGDYTLRISQEQRGSECVMRSQESFVLTRASSVLEIGDLEYDPENLAYHGVLGDQGIINLKSIKRSGASPYSLELVANEVYLKSEGDFISEVALGSLAVSDTLEHRFTDLYGGDYTVVLTDSLGCRVEETITLPEDKNIWIPNVFTPNDDGVNDEFYIRNMPTNSGGNWKMIIKNKSGLVVFESDDYHEKNLWNGGDLPADIYYYYLETPEQRSFSGWVKVLRVRF